MINKNSLILTSSVYLLCAYAGLAMAQQCKAPLASQQFISHNNGTVTDQRSGLMWKTCLEGQESPQCYGKPTALQWQDAVNLSQNAFTRSFAGYQDWRLPTRAELETLIEPHCREPATNVQVFPNMAAVGLWSSDIANQANQTAWGIDFTTGRTFEHFQAASKYVRLVRNAH